MITVTYHRKYHRVTVEGHAAFDAAGKDVICAAASMITFTLADRVLELCNGEQATAPVTELKSGNATVSCKPKSRYDAVITLIFDTVCSGYRLLSENYPENIKFFIRG